MGWHPNICLPACTYTKHDVNCRLWISSEEIEFINNCTKGYEISEEDKKEIFGEEFYNEFQRKQKMNRVDYTYLDLLNDVINNGTLKPTRAKIAGKNVGAYSVFGRQARFNFAEGFPILTTKKIHFDSIAHELIWFLSGSSNIKYLQDNKVKIWNNWADANGELGFGTYGTLWRSFPFHVFCGDLEEYYPNWYKKAERCGWYKQEYKVNNLQFRAYEDDIDGGVDQIQQLIDNIKKVKENPTVSEGRRLIVTAWHPYYVDKVSLPPCHVLMQFTVLNDKLICHLYQRSCDLFLGVPFNISSYCLLTAIIAHITNLIPYEFIHTYHDLHVYENHIEQALEQLERPGYDLPKLWINPELKSMDNLVRSDIKLLDYKHDSYIKAEVAV